MPEGTRLTVLVRAQSMCCSANEAQLASHTKTSAPTRLLSHARGSSVREGDQSDAVVGGVVGRSGRLNARTYGPLRFGDLRLGRGVSRLGATQLPAGQSSVCARRSDVCLLMSLRHVSCTIGCAISCYSPFDFGCPHQNSRLASPLVIPRFFRGRGPDFPLSNPLRPPHTRK